MLAHRGPGAPPARTSPNARAAAVLIPLFDEDGEARVVLTRRTSHLPTHQGQVAFPGGGQDPGEELVDAALREAHEEVGLDPATVAVIGELDHLTTVGSGFTVAPFVGALAARPTLTPNPGEVERVFDVTLAELLEDGVYRQEHWHMPWGDHHVSFFELEGDTVWGATAHILRDLLVLVTEAGDLA